MKNRALTRFGVSLLLASAFPVAALAPSFAAPASSTSAPASVQDSSFPDVDAEMIKTHTQEIARITSENGNNRQFGSAGLAATTEYVESVLADRHWTVEKQEFTHDGVQGTNLVIRDRALRDKGNHPNNLVLGVHLDTLDTPGANDNAASIAAVLEIMEATWPFHHELNDMTYVFWGSGASHDAGAKHFIANMTPSDHRSTGRYFDLQGIGAVNGGNFVTAVGGTDDRSISEYFKREFAKDKSTILVKNSGEQTLAEAFRANGMTSEVIHSGGAANFTAEDAKAWKGTVGQPHDPCHHKACDTIDNVDFDRVAEISEGVKMAVTTHITPYMYMDPVFIVSVDPSEFVVQPGDSVTSTIRIRGAMSVPDNATVSFETPEGVSARLSAKEWTSGDDNPTITIDIPSDAAAGWYTVKITTVVSNSDSGYESTDTEYVDVLVEGDPADGGPGDDGPGDGGPGDEQPAPSCGADVAPGAAIADFRHVVSTTTVEGCEGNASATSTIDVDIEHTYRGDLGGWLKAPSGTWYPVFSRSGGEADNIKESFTLDLSKEKANGEWTFFVRDSGPGDTGTLNSWALNLDS